MKIIAFLILLFGFSACNDFEFQREKDDGSISGTVSFIWGQLGVASAHAQTPQDFLDELESYSQTTDLFVVYASDTYLDVINGALGDAQYYANEIGALMSSNVQQYSAGDFPHGAVLVMGFNSNKKLKSFHLAPVTAAGTYSLNDPGQALVSYYKLAFVLNDGGATKYRLSHIFRDGTKMRSDVTQETSTASIKLNQTMYDDINQSLTLLKSRLQTFLAVSKSNPTQDDKDLIDFYLLYSYSEYYTINDMQRFILHSSIYYEMIANSTVATTMRIFQNPITTQINMMRPADRTQVLFNYCSGDAYLEQYLLGPVKDNVDNLSASGGIPAAPIIRL